MEKTKQKGGEWNVMRDVSFEQYPHFPSAGYDSKKLKK